MRQAQAVFAGTHPWSRIGMAALCASAVAVMSCAQEQDGESPPSGSFYYPIGLVADQEHKHVFVVSSNFDLRYNSGWVSTLNVPVLLERIADGGDLSDALEDEFLRVPSLAGRMAVDSVEAPTLAVLTARGGNPLTLLEIDRNEGVPPRLRCKGPGGSIEDLSDELEKTDCDQEHLLTFTPEDVAAGDSTVGAVDEFDLSDPFSVRLVKDASVACPRAVVGFVSWTRVATVPIAGCGEGESLTWQQPARTIALDLAVGHLALWSPPGKDERLVATNRWIGGSARSVIVDFPVSDVFQAADVAPTIGGLSLNAEVGGFDIPTLQFAAQSERAYLANANPDAVVALATLPGVSEPDRNGESTAGIDFELLDAVSVPGEPTGLAVMERDAGANTLLAVTSYDDDAIYFLKPLGERLHIVRRMDSVGRGPYEVIALRPEGGSQHFFLVSLFFDHSLLVIDVSSDNPQEYRIVGTVRNNEVQSSKRN